MSLLSFYEARVGAWFDLAPTPDEVYDRPLPGGERAPMRRYRPRGERLAGVVVLCHGLGGNALCFELDGRRGLAPVLASRGYDVHVAALRSITAGALNLEAWIEDGAAIVRAVLARTGRDSLHWVGHSLGGLLPIVGAYPGLRSLVGIGVPLDLPSTGAVTQLRAALRIAALFGKGSRVPLARWGRLEAPLMGRFSWPGMLSFVSPPNLDGSTARALHAHGTEDLPAPVVRDLVAWCEAPGRGFDARVLRALEDFAPRATFVVGHDDPLAPPRLVVPRAAPCGPRARVVVAENPENPRGYAHVELLAGPRAHLDVFGHVERALAKSSSS